MRLVCIESPYAGQITRNVLYAKKCVLDCLSRGESPYASHLFFTQTDLLDDDSPIERKLGIEAGFAWSRMASLRAFYVDLGWSSGMKLGFEDAFVRKQHIELRALYRSLTSDDYSVPFELMLKRS